MNRHSLHRFFVPVDVAIPNKGIDQCPFENIVALRRILTFGQTPDFIMLVTDFVINDAAGNDFPVLVFKIGSTGIHCIFIERMESLIDHTTMKVTDTFIRIIYPLEVSINVQAVLRQASHCKCLPLLSDFLAQIRYYLLRQCPAKCRFENELAVELADFHLEHTPVFGIDIADGTIVSVLADTFVVIRVIIGTPIDVFQNLDLVRQIIVTDAGA